MSSVLAIRGGWNRLIGCKSMHKHVANTKDHPSHLDEFICFACQQSISQEQYDSAKSKEKS